MKHTWKYFFAAVTVLLIAVFLYSCQTHVPAKSEVTLTFLRRSTPIQQTLTQEEAAQVCRILNSNTLVHPFFAGVPSCGFSTDVSLTVGNQTFAIAGDTCNTIALFPGGRYFSVSEADIEYIHKLFEAYGGYFPCV